MIQENFATIVCNTISPPEKFKRGEAGNWKRNCVGKKDKASCQARCDAQIKKEGLGSNNTETTIETSENSSLSNISKYVKRAFIFILIFLLLSINLIALSVSLQCNSGENVFYKIASAMFAFMFGILYLIFNYYMYRVNKNKDPCIICKNNIFPL
jgi:hypothetical protein